MHAKFAAFSRYCPRVLTLMVLAIVAAVMVLANLTDELRQRKVGGVVSLGQPIKSAQLNFDLSEPSEGERNRYISFGWWNVSYGWPLIWRQYVIEPFFLGPRVAGWAYSPSRLAVNLMIWLVMLGSPAAGCEWLLRRYRPRLRWRLRTMLIAVGMAAVCCAWYTALRSRTAVQDAIIGAIDAPRRNHIWGEVWVKRRGPKWLDLLGADRFRRQVLAAEVTNISVEENRELLHQIARLRELRYLDLEVTRLSPDVVYVLNGLRQLRFLSIETYSESEDDKELSQECLASIGKMTQLEDLRLERMAISGDNLQCLAGLRRLKTLGLIEVKNADDPRPGRSPLLAGLPTLPRLEELDLHYSDVCDDDLSCLAELPRLRSISLDCTKVTAVGLVRLTSLKALDELTIGGAVASPAALEALRSLSHLEVLHFDLYYRRQGSRARLTLDNDSELVVPKSEVDAWRAAIGALRRTKPGIILDNETDDLLSPLEQKIPPDYETLDDGTGWAREQVRLWEEQQAQN